MTTIGLLLCYLAMERSEVGREREAIGILIGHLPLNRSVGRMEGLLLAIGLAICPWIDQK